MHKRSELIVPALIFLGALLAAILYGGCSSPKHRVVHTPTPLVHTTASATPALTQIPIGPPTSIPVRPRSTPAPKHPNNKHHPKSRRSHYRVKTKLIHRLPPTGGHP